MPLGAGLTQTGPLSQPLSLDPDHWQRCCHDAWLLCLELSIEGVETDEPASVGPVLEPPEDLWVQACRQPHIPHRSPDLTQCPRMRSCEEWPWGGLTLSGVGEGLRGQGAMEGVWGSLGRAVLAPLTQVL